MVDFLKNKRLSFVPLKLDIDLSYRKRCCVTICLKGCVTSGWTGKEPSVVLGRY